MQAVTQTSAAQLLVIRFSKEVKTQQGHGQIRFRGPDAEGVMVMVTVTEQSPQASWEAVQGSLRLRVSNGC